MACIVSLLILAVLGLLTVLSKREQGDVLGRISSFLYKICCIYKLPLVERQQVSADLERLHPGMSARELQMDYYVEKIRLAVLVLLLGSSLTLVLWIKSGMEDSVARKGIVERGAVGEGDREVYLIAQIEGEKEEVYLNVSERQLKNEELQQLFKECAVKLQEIITGENESLEQVTQDLYLPEEIEGYPFEIQWNSSQKEILGNDGVIHREELTKEESICLTATLYYEEESYCQDYTVKLPAAKENSLKRKLQEALWLADEESRYEEMIALPQSLEEQPVHWQQSKEDNSLIFLVLTIGAALGVFVLKDKDLHEQMMERKRSLKMAYPVILNKFVLYMGAGMTVRGSFVKIAGDYEKNRKAGTENPAYEEMLYSCNELSAGVSEGLVYERFGKRSGLQEYARFAAMLGQNLKKGNATLLIRLREESEKAMQEDLQYRKKLGEEAETKLLVPMIMMMGIVMLLVMIPAFGSFE